MSVEKKQKNSSNAKRSVRCRVKNDENERGSGGNTRFSFSSDNHGRARGDDEGLFRALGVVSYIYIYNHGFLSSWWK